MNMEERILESHVSIFQSVNPCSELYIQWTIFTFVVNKGLQPAQVSDEHELKILNG
jgi:hypothetical protein